MNPQARCWLFTLNNPERLYDETDFPTCNRLVWQEEIGEKCGTHHLQGYVTFPDVLRRTQLTAMFHPAKPHLTVASGTPKENLAYCTKETFPGAERFVFGDFSKGQGKRKDIIDLRDAFKAGSSMKDVMDDDNLVTTCARNLRFADRCVETYQRAPQAPEKRVKLCIGPAGVGKTYCATKVRPDQRMEEDVYFLEDYGFWEGYTGQEIVVLDEMNGHKVTPTVLNRILDIYPYRVNIKGRSAPLMAKEINITANKPPSQWWKSFPTEALYRRIHVVHDHTQIGAYTSFSHTYSDDNPYVPTVTAMDKYLHHVNNFTR